MIATVIATAVTATMTLRGEQSRRRKRIGLPPFFSYSPVSSGVLARRTEPNLHRCAPTADWGTSTAWSQEAYVQSVNFLGTTALDALDHT